MNKLNIPNWPSYTREEADKVSEVLLSNRVNYWTGEQGRLFEREFAQFCDSEYAIAVANGTVALDLALIALGIGVGDEVIVTPRTFIASVSAIVNSGAVPVFADVDLNSQNITPESVRRVVSNRTKAVVCVHLAGWPCDMDGFQELADEFGLKIIEDCAQAHGARYKGQAVGSFGDVAAWSFCQDKIMTTGGEGGMVTTNSQSLWEKMWSYKDHGKSYEAVYNQNHPPGFRWVHESFGTNWRMTELQAAIGRIQLKRMPDWTSQRRMNAQKLSSVACKFDSIRLPPLPSEIDHAFYKFYVFAEPERLNEGWDRDRIIYELNKMGVQAMQGSCSEVYLEHAFSDTEFRPNERLPNAKALGESSLMFMVHPTISNDQMDEICAVLQNVLDEATAS